MNELAVEVECLVVHGNPVIYIHRVISLEKYMLDIIREEVW
jgi:hypothetical protein